MTEPGLCFICGTEVMGPAWPVELGEHFTEDDDNRTADFLKEIRTHVPQAWDAIVRAHLRFTKPKGSEGRTTPLPWNPGPLDTFVDTRSPRMRQREYQEARHGR